MEKENKKLVLKFDEGFGSYIGEAGWTFAYAMRKASHDLGIDPRAWQEGERTETKRTVTVKVVRKTAEPEDKETGGTPDLPEPPKMKTVYGDIEGEEAPEVPAPEDDGLVFEDALTGAVVKGDDKPEPVVVTLRRSEIFETLKVCLQTLGNIAPALSHVRIEAREQECLISATNLETSYCRMIPARPEAQVTALIPALLLSQEIKALPSEATDVELRITSGKGDWGVSVNGRCRIHGMDPEEFPELPTGFSETVKIANMKEAMGRVIVAVSKDQTRYALTGLYLDLEGGDAVGCDGFRLHHETIEAQAAPVPEILVPANAIKILLKFKGENEVRFGVPGHVAFSLSGGILTARLMDGNYPAYKDIIPKPGTLVTFAGSEFLKLIEGATPLSENAIEISVNGDLVIKSSHGLGCYEWKIPCTREGGKGRLAYHFNPAFLVDAIKAFPADRITLGLPEGGAYGAVVVNDKAIIMPIRA